MGRCGPNAATISPSPPSTPMAKLRHCDEFPRSAAILRCNAVTGHQLRSQAEGGGKYISCFTVHTSSPVRLNIVPLASASEPALLGEDRS